MNLPDIAVSTYLAYVAISVALTVWVARTLRRGGRAFLVRVFRGDEDIADSVNHLLVVGFYLINFGYVALALRSEQHLETARQGVELLSRKVGFVLLVLGAMHFLNLYVFEQLRRHAGRDQRASSGPDWGSGSRWPLESEDSGSAGGEAVSPS